MSFRRKSESFIGLQRFDEVEALWMAMLESGALDDVEGFLAVAHALRKAGERGRADALIGLLGDSLKGAKLWPGRLKVIKEVARLAKTPGNYRKDIEEAAGHAFASKASYERLKKQIGLSDPATNPVERIEKLETAIFYDEGESFFMAGRGAGVVVALNFDLGVCRLDFENDKRVSIPLGAGAKYLTPLPPGHVLRMKIENPEKIRTEAESDPAGMFARLLQSFGRPMTTGEVKDSMIGIVSDGRWSSWWTAARKNPQIIVSGKGAKATYAWNASAEAAEQSILTEFDQSSPRKMLDLARKHGARGSAIAEHFSKVLIREAAKIRKTDPGLAWEMAAVIGKLAPAATLEFELAELFADPMAARTIAAISDRQLRERALALVRQSRPDFARVFSEVFFFDEDHRVLTIVHDALVESGETEIATRLVDETIRYPRRHPHAFYWLCRKFSETEVLGPKTGYPLLFQILDAITSPEFSSLRARLREMFDRGGLGIRIILGEENEDQARRLSESIDRYAGGLEEYRRETIRTALHMKYPSLREPQSEPVFATAESHEMKKGELEHLKKVEIPANSTAIQVAREMGDLRENFEYKAARQRAEYLSARVSELMSELSRVRVILPEEVDTSVVRIGARILIRNGDVQRDVTILGPWESDPERGVYSNQSEAAKALLGRKRGDLVTFMGNDYEIESIERWK